MQPLMILPSTTSHKREPLVPTLETFARLGLRDLDLNLNHIIERDTDPAVVQTALAANGQRVWMVSGGWCDFFDAGADLEQTMESVERQIALACRFGVDRIRLFFGRLPAGAWNADARARIASNIARLAGRHPRMHLWFENHDGASSRPDICRTILDDVALPNVRLVFDPINFEHRGVRAMEALREVQPLVAHVHLKGRSGADFCGFGEGDVDLMPALEVLLSRGYEGSFTVEYEGAGDRTLRLHQSVVRARAALDSLARWQL